MSLQTLVMLGLTLSIFLTVLAVGMRIVPADLTYVLSRPGRLARSLLAMNILAPIVTIAVCKLFSMHPAVTVALVTLSIAPVGVLFSNAMLPLVAPERAAYARGLLFASTVLSVILTPLAVEAINLYAGSDFHVSPWAVASVVVSSLLVPLGIGMAVGRVWPAARAWIPTLQKVSSLVLLVCAVAIIAGAWSVMGSVMREGTVSAIVIITLIGLAVGHFLGGPDEDERTVLALATVSRHPGIAMAVASLTGEALAPIGALLAVILGELAAIPYKQWRKRRRVQLEGLRLSPGELTGDFAAVLACAARRAAEACRIDAAGRAARGSPRGRRRADRLASTGSARCNGRKSVRARARRLARRRLRRSCPLGHGRGAPRAGQRAVHPSPGRHRQALHRLEHRSRATRSRASMRRSPRRAPCAARQRRRSLSRCSRTRLPLRC